MTVVSHPSLYIAILIDTVVTTTVSSELTQVSSFETLYFEEEQSSFLKIINWTAKDDGPMGERKILMVFHHILGQVPYPLSGISGPPRNQYEVNLEKYFQYIGLTCILA